MRLIDFDDLLYRINHGDNIPQDGNGRASQVLSCILDSKILEVGGEEMDIRYAAKRHGKYLQGIEANKRYVQNSKAPTIGVNHGYSEYKTLWGNEPKYFEHITFSNYLKTLFEEYRWGDKEYCDIKIIAKEGE